MMLLGVGKVFGGLKRLKYQRPRRLTYKEQAELRRMRHRMLLRKKMGLLDKPQERRGVRGVGAVDFIFALFLAGAGIFIGLGLYPTFKTVTETATGNVTASGTVQQAVMDNMPLAMLILIIAAAVAIFMFIVRKG